MWGVDCIKCKFFISLNKFTYDSYIFVNLNNPWSNMSNKYHFRKYLINSFSFFLFILSFLLAFLLIKYGKFLGSKKHLILFIHFAVFLS